MEEVTLRVGTWYSTCSACDGNADPYEKAHLNETMKGEGCGAVYTSVRCEYLKG